MACSGRSRQTSRQARWGRCLSQRRAKATSRKAGGDQPQAYHGYRYRMLTGQGRDAPGGAYDYLLDERMIGGFAVVAYPAKYGVSGVMTFIVNHDGRVFQKNLGKNTEAAVARLRTFNPDASWKAVE
ncbi:MAG: DUF2950 family protein [Candidatus Accumulibacter delftensis]